MTARPPPLNCSDAVPASELVDDFATSRGFNRAMVTRCCYVKDRDSLIGRFATPAKVASRRRTTPLKL